MSAKPVKRIFGLDLLRVIAVFAVMFAHAGHSKIFGIKYGYIAIESFFVMSGFLIGAMLIKEFQHGFTFSDLRIFWVKRWFRTLPLYYAVLLIKYFFLSEQDIGANILYYILFLQNNFYGIQFFAVSWTLVLEEWFYVVMPILIFLFFRKGITPKKFSYFVYAVVVASLLLRFFYGMYRSDSYDAVNGNFVLRFDAFIIGVGLASIKIFYKQLYEKLSGVKYFLLGWLIIIFSQLFYYGLLGGSPYDLIGGPLTISTWFFVMDVGVFFILPFLCESSIFSTSDTPSKSVRVLTWFSLLSYPMYLIHMEVNHFLPKLLPFLYVGGEIIDFLINTIITVLLSYIIYEIIHEPMIKMRSYTVRKMKVARLRKNTQKYRS